MTTVDHIDYPSNWAQKEPSGLALLLERDCFHKLSALESLTQVGAYTMAVLAYAHGSSLDFSHAMADCSPDTR